MDLLEELETALIGMTEDEARDWVARRPIDGAPLTCRIAGRGGKSYGPMGRLDDHRVSLDLENGIVKRIGIG